jgi:hypothetical protein
MPRRARGGRRRAGGRSHRRARRAGIGKTRFVEELQSIGAELGFARHIGWALDFGVERGRGALGALVRSLLDLSRDALSGKACSRISLRIACD